MFSDTKRRAQQIQQVYIGTAQDCLTLCVCEHFASDGFVCQRLKIVIVIHNGETSFAL
jgi:hypothetical protein